MTPPTLGPVDLTFVLAYLLVAAVAGYAAVSSVLGPGVRHWAELAGLSVAAGVGLASLGLFLASVAGLPPTRGVIAGGCVATAVGAAAVVWRRGRLATPSVPARRRRLDPTGVVGLLAAAAVAAAVANVRAEVNSPGLADIDEYATWMFKAKALSAVPLRPVPAVLVDPGLSYSHQDYPLLLPLLVAGAYAAVGRVDESAGKLVLLPMYLSLVAVVYGAVRRDHRRAVAVIVTAVAVAGPTVVEKAGLGVGELPVTLYVAATASLLARWTRRHERPDLLLAGGFAAAAAFSKNEGLALLPVFGVAALVYAACRPPPDRRRLLADWTAAAVGTAVLIGPWLAYRLVLPKTHEDYGGRFASAAALAHGVARLPSVLASVVGHMLSVREAGAVWLVLALTAAAGRRALAGGPARVLWAVLLAQLGLYVAAFVVTPWDPAVLVPMVTPKLLAQAAPVAAVLISLHLSAAGLAGPAADLKS